jgi:hypothetical protein
MDNETELGGAVKGRTFRDSVYGDSAAEIEIAALSAAQEFFGDGVPLAVVPDYETVPLGGYAQALCGGKKYAAAVTVRADDGGQ